jgi:glycosyltransferase involved in cell wall biosynthesis
MAKILHLIGTLGQFDGSASLRLLAQAQAEAGHQVRVFTFSSNVGSRKLIEQHKLPCEVIRKRWGYDPFAARQLAQSLREYRPDVAQLWGRRACDAALTVRRALPDAALIATLAEVPQLRNPWWPNKSLDMVDAIVVEREAIRADFVDAGQGEAKVHVVRPGVVPPHETTHSRRELLLYLGLPTESRLIAIAGPLERSHLVDEAIWCFELIRILHDGAALVIVGDGPERGRLERFTRQVTDSNVVRFVPDGDLFTDVLAQSEIYWQPGVSRWIPSSLLTAMSQGLPVIAADVPAHREAIQNDLNGFLIPPAKRAVWGRQTDQLLCDADLRARFSRTAQQAVGERFSATQMAGAYDQLVLDFATANSPV